MARLNISDVMGLEWKSIDSKAPCRGKSKPGPSRAEVEEVVAEARRILAKSYTGPTHADLQERLTRAQWNLNCTPEVQVDYERHYAATKTAAWAAAKWGIRQARVKWYNRGAVPDPLTRGFFDEREPDAIWLRSDLKSWDLLGVICHEVSHQARHALGLPQIEAEVDLDSQHLVRRYVAEVVNA